MARYKFYIVLYCIVLLLVSFEIYAGCAAVAVSAKNDV